MATQNQINELMHLFAKAQPRQGSSWQQRTSTGNDGMLGVLIYLYRTNETATAGAISKVMHITTGRVSVLIRKMVEKGLITRETGKEDARITEISITDKGRQIVEELQKQRNDQMGQLIDTIGMERLRAYIETSKEVWSILKPINLEF